MRCVTLFEAAVMIAKDRRISPVVGFCHSSQIPAKAKGALLFAQVDQVGLAELGVLRAFDKGVRQHEAALAANSFSKAGFLKNALGARVVGLVFRIVVAFCARIEQAHGLLGPMRHEAKLEVLDFVGAVACNDGRAFAGGDIRVMRKEFGLRNAHAKALFHHFYSAYLDVSTAHETINFIV